MKKGVDKYNGMLYNKITERDKPTGSKKEAQKEITAIKNLLTECAGLGLVQCFPGWCTGYNDYKGTLAAIKAAVKEMRQEMRQAPTWSQYRRAEQ